MHWHPRIKVFFINFQHKPIMLANSLPRGLMQGITVVALAVLGLAAPLLSGPASGRMMVVFPPWWDAVRTVNAAAEGGSVVKLGPTRFVVLVAPEAPRGRERLWQAG